MFRQAEGFVQRSERTEFKCLPGYRRIEYKPNGVVLGRIQIFAADDRTGDGAIYTLALVDELHRHRDLRLYRTWTGKRNKRKGQIGAISTRGEPGGEFEVTLKNIRQSATDVSLDGTFLRAASSRLVLHEWGVPEGGDVENMALVKAANPLSTITSETLAEKRASPTMTLGYWRRFVCNMPTRSEDSAITEAEWYGAKSDDEIPEGQPIWLGLDVAWKWDTTAAVPLWMSDPNLRLLGPATILVPPRDSTSLDPDEVEAALLAINERNPIHTVVMDTSRAEQLASWIEKGRPDEPTIGARVIDWPQTIPQEVLEYDQFMEALRLGWLKHTGDSGLTAHVLNAIAKVLPRGDAIFERPSQSRSAQMQERRVIDALKAASMVHSAATMAVPAEEPIAAWG